MRSDGATSVSAGATGARAANGTSGAAFGGPQTTRRWVWWVVFGPYALYLNLHFVFFMLIPRSHWAHQPLLVIHVVALVVAFVLLVRRAVRYVESKAQIRRRSAGAVGESPARDGPVLKQVATLFEGPKSIGEQLRVMELYTVASLLFNPINWFLVAFGVIWNIYAAIGWFV